jgi:hypothetical protein
MQSLARYSIPSSCCALLNLLDSSGAPAHMRPWMKTERNPMALARGEYCNLTRGCTEMKHIPRHFFVDAFFRLGRLGGASFGSSSACIQYTYLKASDAVHSIHACSATRTNAGSGYICFQELHLSVALANLGDFNAMQWSVSKLGQGFGNNLHWCESWAAGIFGCEKHGDPSL